MIVVKAVAFVVTGLLTLLAVRRVMNGLEAAKVRVKPSSATPPRAPTRLRQDPRTGIYYPEN